MPYIEHSSYPKPNFLNRNSHYSTIYPAKFKQYPVPNYSREKITTDDGDFLNLDWRFQENKDKIKSEFEEYVSNYIESVRTGKSTTDNRFKFSTLQYFHSELGI